MEDRSLKNRNEHINSSNSSERYKENEPYIVGKEAVLSTINFQIKLITDYYERMLFRTDKERMEQDLDKRSKEEMYEQHIKDMYSEWKNDFNQLFAINLDESTLKITESWKYEYSIFEIVRLYKTTDWDKYGLIFMGW